MNEIGKAINKGLKCADMTQGELANRMGVTGPLVSMWVSGKAIPPGDKLVKIATILDIVDDLFPGYKKTETEESPTALPEPIERKLAPRLSAIEQQLENRLSEVEDKLEKRQDEHFEAKLQKEIEAKALMVFRQHCRFCNDSEAERTVTPVVGSPTGGVSLMKMEESDTELKSVTMLEYLEIQVQKLREEMERLRG